MSLEPAAAASVGPESPGAAGPTLAVRGVTKHFQAVTALRDVSIDFHPGAVHVLFGENGAGKSTLIGILAGVYRPDDGIVELDGQPVNPASPREALELGITAVFQEPALVPQLRVAENLTLGREPVRVGLLQRHDAAAHARAALARVGTSISPMRLVRDLSRAERQIVEIARALQVSARVLILDEPTASLTDDETDRLFGVIDRLRAEGLTIIYITHRMQEIRRIGDTVSVLRDGALVRTAALAEVTNEQLVTMMTGRQLGAVFPRIDTDAREAALELVGVDGPTVRDVSLTVRRGEVVGLTGLVGSGKDEVGRLCFGLARPVRGAVRIHGRPVRRHSPAARLADGIVFYPADRKRDGLIDARPVRENTSLSALRRWSRLGFLDRRAERRDTAQALRRLGLRPFAPEALPPTFSGGNQQKVVLSRGFTADYSIHVFDEPTAGVDVGARHDIYQSIKELAEAGAAVLLISSDLPEVIGLAHRAYVMAEGRVVGEFAGADLAESVLLPAFFSLSREDSLA